MSISLRVKKMLRLLRDETSSKSLELALDSSIKAPYYLSISSSVTNPVTTSDSNKNNIFNLNIKKIYICLNQFNNQGICNY